MKANNTSTELQGNREFVVKHGVLLLLLLLLVFLSRSSNESLCGDAYLLHRLSSLSREYKSIMVVVVVVLFFPSRTPHLTLSKFQFKFCSAHTTSVHSSSYICILNLFEYIFLFSALLLRSRLFACLPACLLDPSLSPLHSVSAHLTTIYYTLPKPHHITAYTKHRTELNCLLIIILRVSKLFIHKNSDLLIASSSTSSLASTCVIYPRK